MADPATPAKNFYGGTAVPDKLKFGSLIYPTDLNDNNFYPDCVCFTIQKRTGVSIEAVTGAASAGVGKAKELWNAPDSVPPELAKIMKKERLKGNTVKVQKESMSAVMDKWNKDHPGETLPENLFELIGKSLSAFALKMGQAQTNALVAAKEGRNILGSIYLNMPNGIQFDEKANWGGDSLGFMGKMAQDIVGGGGDLGKTALGAVAGGAGSLVGGAIGALPSLVSKLGLSGGMFGAAIGAMAAGSPMQKGAESALGIAQNPYMEMMFSGVGFRSFNFEFIMRPRNTDEIDVVADILKKFRTFTKPSYTEGVLGKAFMDYPMEFQIEFLTSGTKTNFDPGREMTGNDKFDQGQRKGGDSYVMNPFVPMLKNCVCDSITSNYTPQSIWAAHDQGKPVAVTLGLSFQETELVMAEDVWKDRSKGGGY